MFVKQDRGEAIVCVGKAAEQYEGRGAFLSGCSECADWIFGSVQWLPHMVFCYGKHSWMGGQATGKNRRKLPVCHWF